MQHNAKATKISLFNFSTPHMRAFHMSWFAFFLCFFAWFGIAPLMVIVRDELSLTQEQIGNTIIASVLSTVFARLIIGWCCDRFGPRLSYSCLLIVCSFPVMGIGLAHDYMTFLVFRLAIGAIGASFVITQYHTSVMFAPNVIGTANATTAGWGCMGGGANQLIMPLIFTGMVALGLSDAEAWRGAMVIAGLMCMLTGIAYYFLTQDTPDGNYKELRAKGQLEKKEAMKGSFGMACRDSRVWVLFLVYGACFGVELTLINISSMYFMDYFGLGFMAAGALAACFGMMNLFSRSLGGLFSDRISITKGLRGRTLFLTAVLALEGLSLILFSQMSILPLAVATMLLFSLFVKMAQGATYSVVPFINKKAMGSVAGIVGAGGNTGAVFAGFLFRSEDLSYSTAMLWMGLAVLVCAGISVALRFSECDEQAAHSELKLRITETETAAA